MGSLAPSENRLTRPHLLILSVLAVTLFLSVSLVLSSSAARTADSKARKQNQNQVPKVVAWVSTHTSAAVTHFEVWTCADGIRIYYPQQRVTVVAAPPTWKATYFSDITRKFSNVTGNTSSFYHRMFAIIGFNPQRCHVIPVRSEVHNGLPSTLYAEPQRERGKNYYSKLWYADNPKLPPKAAALLAVLAGVPDVGKIPIEAEFHPQIGAPIMLGKAVTTAMREVPVSSFEVPQGYQQAESDVSVGMSNFMQSDIQDLFGK